MTRPRALKGDDTVAVIAHAGKTFGGGLGELRAVLARAGHRGPIWHEVTRSRQASKAVRRAVKEGAKLVFVWGGDGMVQRCVDELAGTDVPLAILPAGTANLLARNLGIPADIGRAVGIGLQGARLALDVGVMNGERFAVMAGTGFDALAMRDVGPGEKDRLGRFAYLRSGIKAMRGKRVRMKIRVDGTVWFKGQASCLMLGNVGTVAGGLELFPGASPSDGLLEVGVATAGSAWQWLRLFSRAALGDVDSSPFVRATKGKKIIIELGHEEPVELDGGVRSPVKRIKARVEAGAINVCVPKPRATRHRRPTTAP